MAETNEQTQEPVVEGMTPAEEATLAQAKATGVNPDEVRPQGADLENQPDYTTGVWAGHTVYKCSFCEFDSVLESDVVDHVASRHRGAAADRPLTLPRPQLYDQFGNVIRPDEPKTEAPKRGRKGG